MRRGGRGRSERSHLSGLGADATAWGRVGVEGVSAPSLVVGLSHLPFVDAGGPAFGKLDDQAEGVGGNRGERHLVPGVFLQAVGALGVDGLPGVAVAVLDPP